MNRTELDIQIKRALDIKNPSPAVTKFLASLADTALARVPDDHQQKARLVASVEILRHPSGKTEYDEQSVPRIEGEVWEQTPAQLLGWGLRDAIHGSRDSITNATSTLRKAAGITEDEMCALWKVTA